MESSSAFSIGANYWGAQVGTTSETGRVFVTATVIGNTFEFDTSFPQFLGHLITSRTATTPPRIPLHRRSRSAAASARKRRGRTAALDFPGPSATPLPSTAAIADLRRPDRKRGDGPSQILSKPSRPTERHGRERVVRAGLRCHRQRRERRTQLNVPRPTTTSRTIRSISTI